MDNSLGPSDLECLICADVFYEPVTLPCGHTFDKACLCKVLDSSVQCPLCRAVLHMNPSSLNVNLALRNVVKTMFPNEWKERHHEHIKSFVDIRNKVPLMILPMVVYPSMPSELRIFEYRYVYMIKKVLEGSRRFGIVSSPVVGSVGTLLNIECARQSGQRFSIEVKGEKRFRITNIHFINLVDNDDPQLEQSLDIIKPNALIRAKGYYVADVDFFMDDDEAADSDDVCLSSETAALYQTVTTYFKDRPNRLLYSITRFGQIPPLSNEAEYSYWVASAIPIPLEYKEKLLAEQSVLSRVRSLNTLTRKYLMNASSSTLLFKRVVFFLFVVAVTIYLVIMNKTEHYPVVP
mmetsp:Transcript_7776/g.11536  ORF Transcript_7776/g.11536 Transcript_7776/m.11536 type:complete len:349 (+) Transcript_7776:76-1122(+)